MRSPDYLYLEGYRVWQLRENQLYAPHQGSLWVPGINQARCPEGKTPPGCHKECGLYAYKALEKISPTLKSLGVTGRVELWGEVAEYPDGYRAQYARILSLYLTPYSSEHQRQRLERIAEKYSIELEKLDLSFFPARIF